MSRNDITGDRMINKPSSDAYRNSPFWDNIAKKKQEEKKEDSSSPVVSEN